MILLGIGGQKRRCEWPNQQRLLGYSVGSPESEENAA